MKVKPFCCGCPQRVNQRNTILLWLSSVSQTGGQQATSISMGISTSASEAVPSSAVQSDAPVETANKTEATISSIGNNSIDQSAAVTSETVSTSISETEQRDANKPVTVEDSDDESSAAKMEVDGNAESNHQNEEQKEEVR